jgi:hypothetical protein
MKKLLFTISAFMVFVFPLLAQVDHDYNPNDLVPVVNFNLTKDQIPPAIIKAVNTDFAVNNQATWAKFPFALQEYGWVYDKGAADLNLNQYEVTMKTNNGNELFAVYSADGKLLESRELSRNVPVPSYIMTELAKSQYKDWTIVGDKEIIKYFHDRNNVEQHFRVTVEKGNVKKSVSFNYKGTGNK